MSGLIMEVDLGDYHVVLDGSFIEIYSVRRAPGMTGTIFEGSLTELYAFINATEPNEWRPKITEIVERLLGHDILRRA